MSIPFTPVPYKDAAILWPSEGRHIMGTFSDTAIVLYQAYKPSIADYAVLNQTFKDCPDFKEGRMTWLKPNFLWMMYRSGWATKRDQQRILAITISREGFEEMLRHSFSNSRKFKPVSDEPEPELENNNNNSITNDQDKEVQIADVILQWDPDHDPYGEKVQRRAIQLGIRCEILQKFLKEWIIRIDDITDFVTEQRQFIRAKNLDKLQVPDEKVYQPLDQKLKDHIELDTDAELDAE